MHTFNEALKLCKANQKIIWGTKTEMFHLIDKDDRDFNTSFSTSKKDAEILGEIKTVLKSIGRL